MTLSINATDDDLMAALRMFLLQAFAAEVIQGQANRVTMPQGNFIEMTPLLLSELETPASSYVPINNQQIITSSIKWTCQLDFYGDAAGSNAAIFLTVIRTAYACDIFASAGFDFQPLYCGDPHNTAMINGEQQYENRYTLDFIAQFNPVVTVPQDFASTINIVLKEVDETFPP